MNFYEKLFAGVFSSWSAGDRAESRKLLRGVAMLYPRNWSEMLSETEPPAGFIDDMLDVNEYDEWVILND